MQGERGNGMLSSSSSVVVVVVVVVVLHYRKHDAEFDNLIVGTMVGKNICCSYIHSSVA
jgi:hypothetical protein